MMLTLTAEEEVKCFGESADVSGLSASGVGGVGRGGAGGASCGDEGGKEGR